MRICSHACHACLAKTYKFQCCLLLFFLFLKFPVFDHVFSWKSSLLSFPCVLVCVFAAATLDLLHSGDDVRAGREVLVESI